MADEHQHNSDPELEKPSSKQRGHSNSQPFGDFQPVNRWYNLVQGLVHVKKAHDKQLVRL